MDNGQKLIYMSSAVVAVAVAVIVIAAAMPHAGAETVWPTGDKNVNFDRYVGVGTTYEYKVTGTDTLDTGVVDITGTVYGEVIAADEDSYTCKETTVLMENGQETRYVLTSTYNREGTLIDPAPEQIAASSLDIDTTIDPKWGPHNIDVDNYTVIHNGIRHFYYVCDGKEDGVCYRNTDSYDVIKNVQGKEFTSAYSLTCILSSMDFQKFSL